MSPLSILNMLVCAAICLCVVFYRRQGSPHRPLASLLAYLIAVSAGVLVLLTLLGMTPEPNMAQIALNAVLCLAVLACRGNVVDLFHTHQADNAIYKLIRRTTHHA